jgi:hypothetical protein
MPKYHNHVHASSNVVPDDLRAEEICDTGCSPAGQCHAVADVVYMVPEVIIVDVFLRGKLER